MLEAITIEPKKPAEFCVIWLHGLGADGHDFENIVSTLGLPEAYNIRFVFPHAPYRPITINMGMEMRAWYDIFTLNNLDHEDATGIHDSIQAIETLIQQQNMPLNKIILAGFSQGGAIALYMGITSEKPYAGVIALSTYLPFLHVLNKRPDIKQETLAILQCHGSYDDIVPTRIGKETYDYLITKNKMVEWKMYPMAHQVCPEEINDISQWLIQRLQALEAMPG